MSYLNTPQAGAPTTPIGPTARRWAPLIGFAASLLILAIIGAVASLRPIASARPEQQPIIMLATTTAAPRIAPRAILCYFDYSRPESAAAITSADVRRVVGMAGEWRLVEVAGAARVWIALADVPVGTPADSPLADLAPQPTAVVIYVPVPVYVPAVEPTAETHFEMPRDRPGPPTRVSPFQSR